MHKFISSCNFFLLPQCLFSRNMTRFSLNTPQFGLPTQGCWRIWISNQLGAFSWIPGLNSLLSWQEWQFWTVFLPVEWPRELVRYFVTLKFARGGIVRNYDVKMSDDASQILCRITLSTCVVPPSCQSGQKMDEDTLYFVHGPSCFKDECLIS